MIIKKEFEDEVKVAYMINYTIMIVNLFLAYKKHYNITKFSLDHIMNESRDEYNLIPKEIQLIKENVKWYLKTYHNVEIINENPIKIRKTKKDKNEPNLYKNKP